MVPTPVSRESVILATVFGSNSNFRNRKFPTESIDSRQRFRQHPMNFYPQGFLHSALHQTAASFLFLASFSNAHAEEKSPSTASGVLGRVGSVEVRLADVDGVLTAMDEADRIALKSDKTRLTALVRSLLVQRLVLNEAKEKKWDQEPAVVEQLNRVRENALVDSYLVEKSRADAEFPSDSELKDAYENGKSSLLVPRTYLMAQIFVSAPKGSPDATVEKAAKQKLESIQERLSKPGADFGEIATAYSEEKISAARGGQIGWLAEAQIQPEIRAKLPTLKLNTLSEPLRLDDGFHIIKVLDLREAHTPTLEQIRPQLTKRLRAERERDLKEAYLTQLLEDNPVAINEVALSELNPQKAK
jgi:parvulin-like peptidyl-prolyl isomerase